MVTITEIFTHVNSHNFPALQIALAPENKKQLEKIKWEHRKFGQYILERCVEVHAKECFDLIINSHDFSDDVYESALNVAKNNYFDYQSNENFHYVEKILEKKPHLKINFVLESIITNNFNIFNAVTHLIVPSDGNQIKRYIERAIYSGNIKVWEYLKANTNQNQIEFLDTVLQSSYAKIFFQLMEKSGFDWTRLLMANFIKMSPNSFEYFLEKLKEQDWNQIEKQNYKNLIEYTFTSDCGNYYLSRYYYILKLPIEFAKLKESYSQLLFKPYQTKLEYEANLLILHMWFELKPNQMKQIDWFFNGFESKYDGANAYPQGKKFFLELLHLLKSNGIILEQKYNQALENFAPQADKAYANWKIINKIFDEIPIAKTKAKAKKTKKPIEIVV